MKFSILGAILLMATIVYSDEEFYHPKFLGPDVSKNEKNTKTTGRNWTQEAQDQIITSRKNFATVAKADNVILFIGDGMGVSTVTAARQYYRQKQSENRDEVVDPPPRLAWDYFPVTGLSMTYNADYLTPDSAGTATAFLCGEKANYMTLGVNENVVVDDCDSVERNKIKSAWKKAMEEGKSAGIVTTTRITHATPAGAYANTPNRNYESSAPEGCVDIAQQLIYENKDFQVILGGGRRQFFPENVTDLVHPTRTGSRLDNLTLYEEWEEMKADELDENRYKFVYNRTGFDDINTEEVEYLLGLLAYDHLEYELLRNEEEEPSLAEMVEMAIKILSKNDKGYYLLVEGGRIDHAHHENMPKKSLEDTVAMHEAVEMAIELSDDDNKETLIVITADHSHVFTVGGYPKYDDPILGIVDPQDCYDPDDCVKDYKPSATLGYVNGPGYGEHRMDQNGTEIPRLNLTGVDTDTGDYVADAGIPLPSETHAGEEVAIYARGPMSYLFMGTHEQHYIPHAFMYASCVGDNKDLCEGRQPSRCEDGPVGSASNLAGNIYCVVIATLTVIKMRLFPI